jgi:hypothetical protein
VRRADRRRRVPGASGRAHIRSIPPRAAFAGCSPDAVRSRRPRRRPRTPGHPRRGCEQQAPAREGRPPARPDRILVQTRSDAPALLLKAARELERIDLGHDDLVGHADDAIQAGDIVVGPRRSLTSRRPCPRATQPSSTVTSTSLADTSTPRSSSAALRNPRIWVEVDLIMFALVQLPLIGFVLMPDRTRPLTKKLNG